jgi:RNA polymerase sigma factor (sigma-70 family)
MDLTQELIDNALSGDKKSLESLLIKVQGYIYNISIRFLWHPQDAEDATQEILVRICTHLSSYKAQSKFTTWCYRIAINHLINSKRSRMEARRITFTSFASDLSQNFDPIGYQDADKNILEEEVKLGCTTGMLLCLDRDMRMAYILGDIFSIKSQEAAEILGITPELFRKRLQTSRQLIRDFMTAHCGVANVKNKCRCNNMIRPGLKRGIVTKGQMLFARQEHHIEEAKNEIQEMHNVAEIFKNHPDHDVPGKVMEEVKEIILSGRFNVLK